MKPKQKCLHWQTSAPRKLGKDQGFTIIEVLLAISIFAVGMLAIASLQLSAINVNSSAGLITERATLAQDTLEWLMSLDFNSPWLEDVSATTDNKDTDGNTHEAISGDGEHAITWAITDVDMPPVDTPPSYDAKRVSVTVKRGTKTTIISSIKSKF